MHSLIELVEEHLPPHVVGLESHRLLRPLVHTIIPHTVLYIMSSNVHNSFPWKLWCAQWVLASSMSDSP